MPMLIEWADPSTHKRESIYEYFSMDSSAGRAIVRSVRIGLSKKFDLQPESIPGFRVQPAPWPQGGVRACEQRKLVTV